MIDFATVNWSDVHENLNSRGFSRIPNLLTKEECLALRGEYFDHNLYRNVISMKRYRFGAGEYKYFNYPLPALVQSIRKDSYQCLWRLANAWMSRLHIDYVYPPTHRELLEQCKQQGQSRSTPLILKYESGGFNTLHQDLYGDLFFPFQMVVMLSSPGEEFAGGEFVMVEQIPRAQSRAQVIPMMQGDAVVFTCNYRPAKGTRGYYRSNMKHGVSEITSGERYALGIIYHDAK